MVIKMAIASVEMKNFLVFRDEFKVDFCPGINVLIGGNGTGKTTLLKALYAGYKTCFAGKELYEILADYFDGNDREACLNVIPDAETSDAELNLAGDVYIPEKDILEHAKGLLTFIEQKQTGFGEIYRDMLLNAQDIPTRNQSATQKSVAEKIADIIGGEIHWDKGDGSFYTMRTDGTRVPFSNEASGFKKLGFLGLLVSCGRLEPGAVLYWDEPENSLNPELVPVLVEILLEISRGGVQIFLATHSEILASYFNVCKKKNDRIMFYSLYKKDGQIRYDSSDRFDLLTPNKLTEASADLYEMEVERGLGDGN